MPLHKSNLARCLTQDAWLGQRQPAVVATGSLAQRLSFTGLQHWQRRVVRLTNMATSQRTCYRILVQLEGGPKGQCHCLSCAAAASGWLPAAKPQPLRHAHKSSTTSSSMQSMLRNMLVGY
jgi:hypothetical protein